MTPAQKTRVAELVKAFGKGVIKAHAPSSVTGMMRVSAKAQSGTWEWTFDREGNFRYASMQQQLPLEGTDVREPGSGTLPKDSSHYKHA